jgi:alpha-beta hydrolase superfamily lysophospholipase
VRQPLLVMHGGADTVTPPAGSRALHEKAAGRDKTLRIFEPALHDLLHEPEAAEVTQQIVAFVTRKRD